MESSASQSISIENKRHYSHLLEKFKPLLDYCEQDPALRPILEHPDFVVFNKPAGMETLSRDGGKELLSLARERCHNPALAAVHRLDRDTSGAQLFSLNAEAEKELTALFRRRQVEKTYLALCLGAPRNRTGVIRRNLSEWEGGRRPVRVVKGGGGLPAETSYRVLGVGEELQVEGMRFRAGLLAFSPHQGRTHQIRVHAASLGCPILGDDNYGDRAANRAAKHGLALRRSALHAWVLAFPWRGGRVEAVCPLPADLAAAFSGAFPGGEWEAALAAFRRDGGLVNQE